MRVTPQVTFSADYLPRIKRTKWLRIMRLDFLSKHENSDRNFVTFCVSVSRLLWYLSNWSAFLGAQRAVFKPYVQYRFSFQHLVLQTVQCQCEVHFTLFHVCKIIYFCSAIWHCAKCLDRLWSPHSQRPLQWVPCRRLFPIGKAASACSKLLTCIQCRG
jgi:hypothetical protein